MAETQLTKPNLIERQLQQIEDKLAGVNPLGKDMAHRAVGIISTMARRELADCTPRSVLLSALAVSKLGLSPDPQLGHVWLIPFREKGTPQAQVIIGYKGFLDLARRGGMGAIRINPVYVNDHFHYEDGWNVILEHVPWWMRGAEEPGTFRAAYLVAQMADQSKTCKVLHVSELDKAKERSAAGRRGHGPWITDTDAMRLKTLVRRSHAILPITSELATALELDRKADTEGETQEGVLDTREILDAEAEIIEGKQSTRAPKGERQIEAAEKE